MLRERAKIPILYALKRQILTINFRRDFIVWQSHQRIFLAEYLNKLTCTYCNMCTETSINSKKDRYSCNNSHPKCLKTANFDQFYRAAWIDKPELSHASKTCNDWPKYRVAVYENMSCAPKSRPYIIRVKLTSAKTSFYKAI